MATTTFSPEIIKYNFLFFAFRRMNKSSTARDDVIWSPEYGLDPADEEAIRNEQLEFLKKHEGHGSQHSLMLIIIIGVLLAFQVVLVLWRKNSPRTYNLCTLIGLWLIPPFMFLARPERWSFTRFLSVWTVFTIMNGWILFAATRRPLNHRTPRCVRLQTEVSTVQLSLLIDCIYSFYEYLKYKPLQTRTTFLFNVELFTLGSTGSIKSVMLRVYWATP